MGIARSALERDLKPTSSPSSPRDRCTANSSARCARKPSTRPRGIGTHDTATNELFEPELVDAVDAVSDRAAHAELKRLAREEGHLVASSAGAASVASKRVAERIDDGELDVPHETVVTIFPDSSERYLSKGIYRSFEEWTS